MFPFGFRFTAAAVFVSVLPTLPAQIQTFARLDGEMLPIVTYREDALHVLKDGRKRQTGNLAYEVRPASEFAEGHVEITDVQSDFEPLRDASPKERSKPNAVRFRFSANLTADRDLPDCYALLTVSTGGSVGTRLISVGRLSAKSPKAIKAELRSWIDAVGSVHVFSRGNEVRSNQHPDAYDGTAYMAKVGRSGKALSAAELLKYEDVFPHVLSRDGQRLATVRKRDGKKQLIVYDLASMKVLQQAVITEADDALIDLTWVSDHEIAFVAEEDYEDFRSYWSLRVLDVQTGKSETVLKDVEHIIMSLTGRPEVLVVRCFSWNRGGWWMHYDVHARKASKVDEPAAGYYYFDRNGVARVMLRADGDGYTYRFRATPTASWRDLDEAIKQPGLRFDARGGDFLDRVADIHSVGPDGDTLYVSTRVGTDRFELAAFSMSEGVIKRTIAKHPKYDLDNAQLLFARESPQLLGLVFQAQKPQIIWLHPDYAAVQQSIDRALPGKFNLPLDWSADGSTFIYYSSSDQDAGTFYVLRPREAKLMAVLRVSEQLEGKTLAQTVPLEFAARDGFKIPAYITRPLEMAGPAPLVVIVHGGPMARDSWGFDPEAQFLASRGYIVLKVNYRGSSGYGAAFQNAGLRARLDTVVLDDIADGVRYLIAQGEVDPSRVAIMGGSFGGWATYLSLIKYPELYRVGVATAAISNWRRTLFDDRWLFSNKVGYTFLKSLLGRESFAADEKFIDPLLRAAELKQPIYIMHGRRDWVVNGDQSDLMLRALRKTNTNVHSRGFPRAGHSAWSYDDSVLRLNEIAGFLERYLGPAKSDSAPATQVVHQAALDQAGDSESPPR